MFFNVRLRINDALIVWPPRASVGMSRVWSTNRRLRLRPLYTEHISNRFCTVVIELFESISVSLSTTCSLDTGCKLAAPGFEVSGVEVTPVLSEVEVGWIVVLLVPVGRFSSEMSGALQFRM